MRAVKNALKRAWRSSFELGQRLGFSVLPTHFYSQVPNIAELKRDTAWKQARDMSGILGTSIEDQLEFVRSCIQSELEPCVSLHRQAVQENGEDGGYGPVEAAVLYSFIREKKPAKVVQIGCGVSTAIVLRAAREIGYRPEVVCIEPFPMPFLTQRAESGELTLIREKAQLVDIAHLTSLNDGDLFFVDSTHTVKPGSEVNRIILEVLPKLSRGTFVHFHDIYFPYDYKRDLLTEDLFFWSESTLLMAFLNCNQSYRIGASLSMLHYAATEQLQQLVPGYEPQENDFGLRSGDTSGKHFPSSIFLQVI